MQNFSSPSAKNLTVAFCVLFYFLAFASTTNKDIDLKFSAYA